MAHSHKWSDTRRLPAGGRKQPFPGFRIARTAMGKGLFTARPFALGEVVGEITGQTIEDPDYCSRYAFDLEDGRQLEPEPPFRFVNHSCDPNCSFEVLEVRHAPHQPSRRQVMLFAIYPIDNGDELTIDYNWPIRFAIPCKCRSEYCRGWVVGEQHLDADGSAGEPLTGEFDNQLPAPTEPEQTGAQHQVGHKPHRDTDQIRPKVHDVAGAAGDQGLGQLVQAGIDGGNGEGEQHVRRPLGPMEWKGPSQQES